MAVSLLIAVGFFLVADVLAFLAIHARICRLEARPVPRRWEVIRKPSNN